MFFDIFTTSAKPVIVCGQRGIPPLDSNFIPLKTGNIGQLWNIGQFELLVIQLDDNNNHNGKYSGYGVIGISFLMNMPLIGKFGNITVNEAMEWWKGKWPKHQYPWLISHKWTINTNSNRLPLCRNRC